MGIFLENGIVEILCLIILVLWNVYFYLTKNYQYWKKRGVPCEQPEFPFGSTKDDILMRTFLGKCHENIYKKFPNERYYGIVDFREPNLVIKDPELIKMILVKDFHNFTDRPGLRGNPKEYMTKHLLNLVGKEWKDMRSKLTPTFSSGKMKLMFILMEGCSDVLKQKLDQEIESKKYIDAKDLLARFTMDIIATCAFGLDMQTQTQEGGEFYRIFGNITTTSKIIYLRRLLGLIGPGILKYVRVNLVKPEVRDFVTNLVRDTIEYRKKNNIKRNDFLDLLMSVKHNKEENSENNVSHHESINEPEGLTIEQMAPQAFVFFVAGFETASSLMAFCLYELSCHQDIQEQLYNDILEAASSNDGKLSYQTLMEVPFLDQVINETLRLYGSAHILFRICTKEYRVPDSDLVVEKGTKVIIPLFAIHHDPKYYPDPYEFKPERFTLEETKKRHPFVFMPFGEGPRNCIGMRFGLMQAKVGLSTVLLNYLVELSPHQKVPIEINNLSLPLIPDKPVLLKFTKRDM